MACMTHECTSCGHAEFNNSRGPSMCPKCGEQMHHDWDEQNDYDRERERERDDEDREEQ
jgi:predicted  nucleic acid-binding Zn-ribbon protein